MKSKILNKLHITFAAVLSIGMLATSCIKDLIPDIHPDQGEDEAMVTFALKLPSNTAPKTRALNPAAEDKVNSIEIIAFKDNVYSYITYPITAISDNKFTVKLIKGEFDLLVLANSKNIVDALPSLTGKTKQQVLDLLTTQITAADKKWDANTGSGTYRHIPMSSLVFTKDIQEGTDFSEGKDGVIKLHRMLGKVDVKVTGDAAVNFKLLEVDVFNYNLLGNVVPKFVTDVPMANVPVQSRDGVNSYVQYMLGAAALAYESEIYLMEAENLAADGTTPLPQNERTCLVVRGEYEGKEYYYRMDFSNNTTFMNVLRNHQYVFNITKVSNIGFPTPEEAFLAGPVNMTVEVVAWNNGNMSDIQTNGRNNMGVSQSTFEFTKESTVGNVLKVYTDYHGSDLIVSYSTSATDPTQTATWMTNPTKTDDGATSGLKTYTLGFDVTTNDDVPRTGYIHLRAGSLNMVVNVVQTDTTPISLKIFSESAPGVFDQEVNIIQFIQDNAATAPTEQKYKIKWSPNNAEVAINMSSLGANYEMITWSGTAPDNEGIITDPNGEKIFTVLPTTFTTYVEDSFAERQSLMTTRMVVSGETSLKTVVFQQVVKDMQIIPQRVYIMDGIDKKQYVTVKSNVEWELEVTKNISSGAGTPNVPVVKNLVVGQKLVTNGNYNLPQGSKVFFTPVEDLISPTIYTGNFGLNLNDKALTMPSVPADLLCASGIPMDGKEANSYILNPTNGGLLIPVRNANGVITTRDGTARIQPNWPAEFRAQITSTGTATDKYGAKLLWTDTPGTGEKGLADDAAISRVIHVGEGPDGYILVVPGTSPTRKMGNAVVAITRTPGVGSDEGTGNILWSFHIWVTDYAPDVSSIWMDRNLGAVNSNTSPVDVGSRGNYYQWGRKDAFPGPAELTQASYTQGRPIYTANGLGALPGWVAAGNVLAHSILNPMTASGNWTGGNDVNKNLSWTTIDNPDTGLKTAYDPCPDGWRVPIRNSALTWNNLGNTKHWGNETTNVSFSATWDQSKLGSDWSASVPYKGGYYPAAGSFNNSGLNEVGNKGYYWSASSAAGANVYVMNITFDQTIPSLAITRYDALSVRCIAE